MQFRFTEGADMAVVILFGTETGSAEDAAEAVREVLAADPSGAFAPTVHDMSEYAASDLDPSDFLVVVCSTYGDGELPTGAEPFADDLDATRPDLTGLRFTVFGLGDIVYDDSFNRGADIMAEKLTGLGAEEVGEHFRHDYSTMGKPSVVAREWAAGLASTIGLSAVG